MTFSYACMSKHTRMLLLNPVCWPKAFEVGICAEDIWEEPHLFVLAKK